MIIIDNRETAEKYVPKKMIPMIETAPLIRNEVTIPQDSSLDTFALHLKNLDRLRIQMFKFMLTKFDADDVKDIMRR